MSGEGEPVQYVQQPVQYVQQPVQYVQQPQYVQQQQYGQQPQYVQQQYGQQPVQYIQQPQYTQQQQLQYAQQNGQQPVQFQPVQGVVTVQTNTTVQGEVDFLNFQPATIQGGEPGEFGCGTSNFGTRMDFKARVYHDIFFSVLWLASLLLWLILLIVFASKDTSSSSSSSSSSDADGAIVGKIIGAFIIVCTIGILCGYMWLAVMFRYAKNILKFLIGLKLLFWLILSVVFLILGVVITPFLVYGIICLVFFGLMCLYYWCIRHRLKLAAAMIRLGTKVVQQNQATIMLQFLTSVALIAWWIVWISVLILYSVKYHASGLVIFLMVFMHYWVTEVLANIAHVTTCAVTAVWWFSKDSDRMKNPTWNSYRFATTKGLGSICCGSFLVALIRTLKAMAKAAGRKGNIVACLCYILLAYLEWVARYFNVYAFVQVALYGVSFWQAAQNTWQLLWSKGFDAIINDDLSNLVLAAGAFVGGVITCLLGALLGYVFFISETAAVAIYFAVIFAVVGFYIGYYFTLEFMFAVWSAIKAIFVCWAEDPAALRVTHPRCYDLMAEAWKKVYGLGGVTEIKGEYELD